MYKWNAKSKKSVDIITKSNNAHSQHRKTALISTKNSSGRLDLTHKKCIIHEVKMSDINTENRNETEMHFRTTSRHYHYRTQTCPQANSQNSTNLCSLLPQWIDSAHKKCNIPFEKVSDIKSENRKVNGMPPLIIFHHYHHHTPKRPNAKSKNITYFCTHS